MAILSDSFDKSTHTSLPSYRISHFDNIRSTLARVIAKTWAQIVRLLSTPKIQRTKDAGALWSPAIYDPLRRAKSNVKELCALVLDVDYGLTFDEAVVILRNLGATSIIDTTFSHKPEDHRFRIVILLATPITPRDYSKLFLWARKLFDDRIDAACSDPGRMFFWPSVPNKAAHANFRFQNFIGTGPLDWGLIIAATPDDEVRPIAPHNNPAPLDPVRTPDGYNNAAIAGECERVLSAQAGDRNNALNKAAYNLARLGIDHATVESLLTDAALRVGLSKSEIKATIKSGYNAGVKKPRIISSSVRNIMQKQAAPKSQTTGNGVGAQSASSGAQAKQTTSSTTGNGAGAQAQAQATQTGAANTPNAAPGVGQPRRVGVYEATPTGLIRHSVDKHGNHIRIPLTNYNAEIVSDIIEDDGESQKRVYEVAARLNGRSAQFHVEAEDLN